MAKLLSVTLLVALCLGAACQSCTLSDDQKLDCGYMGINQAQCEAKSCCWRPVYSLEAEVKGTPWCFYPSGQDPCPLNFTTAGGPGFDSSFYNSMYTLYEANINIQSKGGVVAAPDNSTPGGSYYYHWMRDAGLTMRAYQELNDFNLSKIESKMKAYVSFVVRVQNETDPNGFDIRINPKFELPNGEVFVGGWCRPQTDGPALTAGSLILFANNLIDNGQESYVKQYLWTTDGSYHGGAIKYDLDWVINNWQSNGCDLWEEIRDTNFFWNRMAFAYSLGLASTFATRMGDSTLASRYASVKKEIEATLDGHWTGSFFQETASRQKDGAVIHALSSFPGFYSWTDSKVASTIKVISQSHCLEFPINQIDNKNSLPGVLLGRYPGDSYAGGNPWQLLTAVLAELFYKGASAFTSQNEPLTKEVRQEWSSLLKIHESATHLEFAQAALQAGDAVMYRLFQHIKNDGGHVAEQIGKNSGAQTSAKDLTWSYANCLTALHYRNTHLSHLTNKVELATE